MNKEKNSWDKLINLPDEYQTNPDLAENAISKIKVNEKTNVKRKRKSLWVSIAASFAACLVCLSVFLPIYLTPDGGNEVLYYSSESIAFSPIENINEFVSQNNLDILYFDNELTTNHSAHSIKDNKLVFINQSTVFIGESDIDIVTTKIVVLKDADFYFSADYKSLSESIKINEITVYYFIPDNPEQLCRINFKFNNVIYFMDIDSGNSSIETIEKYVTLLLG